MKKDATKKVSFIFWGVLALLIAAEFIFIPAGYGHGSLLYLKGFHILLGLLGGAALMFFAKALGKWILYRKENYYD